MREIKFRGKRVDNNQWVYGYLTHTNKKMNPCIHIGVVEVYEVDPKSVGQFTGLFDKNFEEIYEGDVVSVYDENRTVIFKNAFWNLELCENAQIGGFGTEKSGGLKPLYRYPQDWIEVIGNIYKPTNPIK